MCAKTELRGALGGGLGAMTWQGGDVPTNVTSNRVRLVPGKRQVLSNELTDAFAKMTTQGCSASRPTLMAVIGHTRYPTSSRSLMSELHPHMWSAHTKRQSCWFSDASIAADDVEPPVLPCARSGARCGFFITHNGDFDEYELFRQRVSYVQVGKWLERVLHAPDLTIGDSNKFAGMMELLTTKGDWMASVRYAYQKCIAESIGDAADGDALLGEHSANTAPSRAWCERIGAAFSQVWVEALKEVPELACQPNGATGGIEMTGTDVENKQKLEDKVSLVVGAAVSTGKSLAADWAGEDAVVTQMPPESRDQWVICIVDSFLNGDMYEAMSEFLEKAHGSFGLQAVSTTEPGNAVIAAKGQTMRLAVVPGVKSAIWGSEGTAVEVPIANGGDRHILRLDSVKGQVVEVKFRSSDVTKTTFSRRGSNSLNVAGFSLRSRQVGDVGVMNHDEIKRQLRLVKAAKPKALPRDTGRIGPHDAVLEDIRAIPSVLDAIVGKWRDGVFSSSSKNRASAKQFVKKMGEAMESGPSAMHLVVVGIEVSLFVSEQFAADVTEFIPGANACAISSNQLIGGGKVYFASKDSKGSLSIDTLSDTNAVVLVVSQSGQTFPSLKATARLVSRLHDRVFVMVGGTDADAAYSEMGSVVLDHHKCMLHRDGADHVFCNLSGFRPCEPSSVAVVAAHQTLTELLVFTRLGIELGEGDVKPKADFKECVVALTAPFLANIRDIVGCDSQGKLTVGGKTVEEKYRHKRLCEGHGDLSQEAHNTVHEELVAIGWRWGKHISEPWRIMFLTGVYYVVALVFGVPLFHALLHLGLHFGDAESPNDVCWDGIASFVFSFGEGCEMIQLVIGTLVALLDAVLFIMFPVFVGRLLRFVETRPLYHRFGKRSIVVADNAWVARCSETFTARLFSLAYGFASPDVHSADPVDDLIHTCGHRSTRGLLVAVGRPDGRLFAFTKTEAAVLLASKQMSFVENLNQNPEVVSLGSNPHYEARNIFAHVALPSSSRPKFVDEFLYSQLLERQKLESEGDAKSITPRNFLKGLRSALRRSNAHGGGVVDTTAMGGVMGLDSLLDMSSSMSDSSSGLTGLMRRISSNHNPIMDGSQRMDSSQNHRMDSSQNHRMDSSQHKMDGSGYKHGHDAVGILPDSKSHGGFAPGETNVFQANLDPKTGRFLGRFQLSQRLLEARFNSLERFVSFTVMFHAAAESTNQGLWGIPKWDYSRSQSHMRVNTTACPVMDIGETEVKPKGMTKRESSAYLQRAGRLLEVRALRSLPHAMLELVANRCSFGVFPRGSTVVKQGDVGDCLYIVESGQAVLLLNKNNADTPMEVGQCHAGDHFCEGALVRDDFHQPASVVAVTELKCLILTKSDLLSALGAPGNASEGPLGNIAESSPTNNKVPLQKQVSFGHSFGLEPIVSVQEQDIAIMEGDDEPLAF
eukprot:CAMPEP_0114331576 /NCGR_PEP_ID=MMETSP0101-20121206/2506_1 /TAXON_ID=38822 ORGANISM="Pteridomonas danica, Strain PT" /NCGR_SAMPLE_ID=MMETSP0101 /ASSEMBLY_ACC=CAM_ASM_000211 /LENGTH=1431 /DNA_ID=CAMNT_0001461959 /DNA_START=122 /DNA_END=4417 /DNA_ORIENTATION=+